MEPDHRKLIIPTLEALKDSGYLVVVATAHNDTELVRRLYPQKNIIIEDYTDFDLIMPRVDLFVTTEYDTMALCEQHIQAALKARPLPGTQLIP